MPSTKNTAQLNEAKARFKRYAKMFPALLRVTKVGVDKLCFEDDEILLFVVGGKKYKLDKLSIGDFGFVAAPQKIK